MPTSHKMHNHSIYPLHGIYIAAVAYYNLQSNLVSFPIKQYSGTFKSEITGLSCLQLARGPRYILVVI